MMLNFYYGCSHKFMKNMWGEFKCSKNSKGINVNEHYADTAATNRGTVRMHILRLAVVKLQLPGV